MKDTEKKRYRKKVKRTFLIVIVCLIVVFIASTAAYVYAKQNLFKWFVVADLILLALSLISFSFILYLWDIKDLMTEYKEKDNLLSGGLAFTGIFAFMILMFYGLSELAFFTEGKDLMKTMSSLLLTAMPAFLSLLGVQYSVAVQERNRKQDLRLGAKPFFKVQCCKVSVIPNGNGHICHAMRIKVNIKNISQSIGIPLKVVSYDSENCIIELPYTPLANNDILEKEVEVKSEKPYGASVHVALIYRDIYNNIYEMKIKFLQHEKFVLTDTQVLSDILISN